MRLYHTIFHYAIGIIPWKREYPCRNRGGCPLRPQAPVFYEKGGRFMLAQKAWRMIRTLIFTYLVSGVLLTALAFALYKFRLPESQITLGISGVYILSCFMGGFMAGKAMRSRKFLWGLLTGILYFAFLLIMSFLQDRTITADAVRLGTVFAMCSLSAMAGGMIS